MKKTISTILAAVMISSCMVVPAFAYSSDIPSVGQQEYGDNGTTKINAYNTDARVYPTSQAPAMKNTKTINGVTFSEYIKQQESDITLENGEKAHIVRVYVGVDGAMHSSASDARFVFHTKGITAPARRDTIDHTITTGERSNYVRGEKFRDLEYWLIKPFADKKGTGGEYVGNLTWQFLKDEDRWALYEEELTYDYNGGYASYSKTYDITTFVNGVQTNFIVIVTTDGTPKGDNSVGNGTATLPVGGGNTSNSGNSGNTGTTTPVVVPAKTAVANPTTSKIFVNGKEVAFDAYNINGNNYFKLRDVALTVRKTAKQFEVQWDPTMIYTNDEGKQARGGIALFSGKAYTTVGGEMKKGDGIAKNCVLTTSPITKDGKPVQFTAYNINGNNYFKLRDLGEAFDFNVSWDGQLKAVVVNTSESYTVD